MKQIAIFGGSFSPVHLGHLHVAENVLKLIPEIDEVWLTPTYKHRFGKDKNYISNRLELLKKVETDKIKICTYEIDNKLEGGTYEFLKRMKEDIKDCEFSFIIGSDCVYDFEKWKNYKELANLVRFIIAPRKGFELKSYDGIFSHIKSYAGIFSHSPHIILDIIETVECSSTEIRERLKNNKSISGLIPKQIEKDLK